MARWDVPLIWILCWRVAFGSMDRSWCYTKNELPHTIGCNDGNVLSVLRAVPSVRTLNDRRFCQDPLPSSSDCQLAEHQQTDHFRRMCNMQKTCVFLLVWRPQNTCLAAPRGAMYLHMEYSCIPDISNGGAKYPIVRPSLSKKTESVGSVVWIQSSSYPSVWEDLLDIPCTVSADVGIRVTVTVRDLAVSPPSRHLCGFNVQVGNGTRVCAKLGMAARTVTVAPSGGTGGQQQAGLTHNVTVTTRLAFTAGERSSGQVQGRYWVEITGFTEDGALPASVRVTCTNPRAPEAAASLPCGRASAWIWVPILLVLLIIVIVIIAGIIIWCLRKRKKANISVAEGEDESENEGRGALSRMCLSICPWRSKVTKDSNTDSVQGSRDHSWWARLCGKGAPTGPQADPKKDDMGDECRSLDERDNSRTWFSRLRNRISRKKAPPPTNRRESDDVDVDVDAEQDKLMYNDSGVSDNMGSGSNTPEKERLNADTTLNRSETAV